MTCFIESRRVREEKRPKKGESRRYQKIEKGRDLTRAQREKREKERYPKKGSGGQTLLNTSKGNIGVSGGRRKSWGESPSN